MSHTIKNANGPNRQPQLNAVYLLIYLVYFENENLINKNQITRAKTTTESW